MSALITARLREMATPRRRRETGQRLLCILPLFVLLGALVVYPVVQTLYLSFMRSTLLKPDPTFVGLDNYRRAFADDSLSTILRNSAVWTIAVVVGQLVLGMLSAALLTRPFIGRGLLRTLVVIPWVTPGVIAAILWKLMYDPYLGAVNHGLISIGLTDGNTAWLAATNTAMFAVIVVAIWKGFALSTLMYMAALQGVPADLYEAARVDGARPVRLFWHVTLPSIAPTIRSTVLLSAIWTFGYFDLIYVMTGGGPGDSTEIFPTYIYSEAFENVNYGMASTYGVISMVILSVVTMLYLRQLKRVRGSMS